MLREVKATQRQVRVLAFRVDGGDVAGGTATQNGLNEGTYDGTITENSSGDYTITFAKPFVRVPAVFCQSLTDALTLNVVSVTAAAVRVEQCSSDQTTPVADGDFHLLVWGFDVADKT